MSLSDVLSFTASIMNPICRTETYDTETCTSQPAELIYIEENQQAVENVLDAATIAPNVTLSGTQWIRQWIRSSVIGRPNIQNVK